MTHSKQCFIGIFFILILATPAYSQNLLNYANTIKYADYLFETQQYHLAALEYERVIFLQPRDSMAQFKLIQAHRYLENYDVALNKIAHFYPGNLSHLPVQISDEYVKNLLHEHHYQKASFFLSENSTMDPGSKAAYRLGILTLQHKWDEAKRFEAEQYNLLSGEDHYNKLTEIISEGLNTHYKSPPLAASLSAIIPGSGKIYTHRWKDAIYSFLFVAAGSWLTYQSYTNNGVGVNSIIWGSITFGFYSANIYGSFKSARNYNHDLNQTFSREVEEILLNAH